MVLAAIDVETKGLDATGNKYILGCYIEENKKPQTYHTRKELWNKILYRGKELAAQKKNLNVYAHNMQYDFWNICNRRDKHLKWFSQQPFICEYKLRKGRIMFLDTTSIYRMPLKKVGEIIGKPKIETPQELTNQQENLNLKEIETYCIRDTEIVLESVQKIKQKLKEDNINLKRLYTINQIGIQYFLELLKKRESNYFFQNKKTNYAHHTLNKKYVHSAYRGGRIECWKLGLTKNVNYIDINNLYGKSAMTIKFPDLRTENKIIAPLNIYTQKELLNKIGLSRIAIKNEKDNIGILPVRTNEFNYYPKQGSIIIGTYTHDEIRKALDTGHTLIDIESSVTWEEASENPYETIIPHIYKKRKESKTELDNYFYKQMMNSSFGKLAQTRSGQEIIIDSVERAKEYLNKQYNILQGIQETYDYMYQKEKRKQKLKKYYAPIIPTLINAKARTIMHEDFHKIGLKNLIYTDTDSIIFKGEIPNNIKIGKKIGEYKIEYENAEVMIWGRKTYRIENDLKASGIVKSTLKKEDFDNGFAETQQMIGMNQTQDINEIGEFRKDIRNFREQKENYEKVQSLLSNKELFIDVNIKNINHFIEKIRELIL